MDAINDNVQQLYSVDCDLPSLDNKTLSEFGLEGIQLRDYQLVGVNWLVERYHRKHGCILGDEMGLGKTCQSISLLVYLCAGEKKGPHLILSPLSVLINWKDELHRFAPDLKVIRYVGDKEARASLRDEITRNGNFDVILTTYEVCINDEQFISSYTWSTLIVDEAHRLKNSECLLHQMLRKFDIGHHVLLTGTPVQNNLKELYSLLMFVAPSVFKHCYEGKFIGRYSDVKNGDASELHELLRPFLLRRVKTEVLPDLPDRSEVVLFHGLSTLQKRYYKALLTRDLEVFEDPNRASKKSLMNILMQLRKCVNHPYLFDGVEPEPFQLGEHLVTSSGKLALLDQLLSHLKDGGHKVLLFSQMTRMLDIIQDYLGYRGYSYERLDGSVRGEERFIAIKNFNNDVDTFIFLLSTRAGGQGLNLVAADTVIFVDSDFNPQNDLQAAARAHRIGQTRGVKVIRLLGRSTVEEIILHRAMQKLQLTNTVIEGGQFSLGAAQDILGSSTNIQDIVMFGVDKLFNEDLDGDLDEVDFERMLGASADGKWKPAETTHIEDEDGESVDNNATEEETRDVSMYMFEGRDYSTQRSAADDKAFQLILDRERVERSEQLSAGRSRAGEALVLPRRTGPPLTAEQLEERREKREATKGRTAEKAEQMAANRDENRKRNKEVKWAANNYTSCSVQSDSEDEDDVDLAEDIQYLSGDVTHPRCDTERDVIIAHCVADCGRWGSGGLFSAISSRCSSPEQQYTLAAHMKDLQLSDVHLIPMKNTNTSQGRKPQQEYVALMVTQHRDRQDRLSGIKFDALDTALRKLSKAAQQKKASVHLPRIGHNTPGFNWYGTERLIRKHLASKGVPTSIYYFQRGQPVKRKASSPVPSTSTSDNTGDRGQKLKRSVLPLPDFMHGVAVYFHNVESEKTRKITRYLIAFDGDAHKNVCAETTHIVCADHDTNTTEELLSDCSENVKVVSTQWFEHCFSKRRKLDVSLYLL